MEKQVALATPGALQMGSGPSQNAPTGGRAVGVIIPQLNQTFTSMAAQMSANQFPLPPSFTVLVRSNTGVSAASTRVFVLNQDILNNITNNGSGANSIVYTYQDGFNGAVLNRLLGQARAGVGAVCFGVALRMNITSSGAGDPAGLAGANPEFITNNALGGSASLNFNITSMQTRQDYDTSIEVIPCVQNLARFVQYGFTIPAGSTATLTFYVNPLA